MFNQGRMSGRDVHSQSFGVMQVADCLHELHPDPDSLEVGQRHDPRDAAMFLFANDWQGRTKGDRHIVPTGEVTTGGDTEAATQIVMTLKQGPRRSSTAMDLNFERRSPKPPPVEFARRHIERPIGLEPLGDIIMTGDSDEAAANSTGANSFGDCGRPDFRDVAIDDAGEFIEGDDWRVTSRADEFSKLRNLEGATAGLFSSA